MSRKFWLWGRRSGCAAFFLGLAAACWLGTAAAAVVETLDNRVLAGKVSLEADGRLLVVTTNGAEHRIPIDQLRLARLDGPPGQVSVLPKGWRAENIGQAVGRSVQQEGALELHLNHGTLTDPKQQQTAHYAYRLLRSHAEIQARLDAIEGTNTCLAGVMLRENLEPTGGYVLLAVSPDRKLKWEWREAGWQRIQRQDLGTVNLPLWLKIQRVEKDHAVTAFRSKDGKTWEKAAASKLNLQTEPFPHETEEWKPKLYAGLAIACTGTGAVAQARFAQPAITASGLMGEYYSDHQFRTLRFTRLDRRIECWWGDGSPAPEIPSERFSVRWTGQVVPRYTELYRFHYEADDSAQLWVNGQELPRARFEEKRSRSDRGVDVTLVAGQPYDIKLEFQDEEAGASIKLGWSSPSQKLEVIPATQLRYIYTTNSPDEETAGTITNLFARKGVYLAQGSYLACDILSADDTATKVAFAGQKSLSILNHKIARIVFRPVRRAIPFEVASDRTGVFLKGGDFLEGQFSGIQGRALSISSVLFGRRNFGIDNADLAALVLNPVRVARAPLEVRLLDGSVLRVRQVRPGIKSFLVDDLTLGRLTLPELAVGEIRNPAAFPVQVASQ